VLSPTVLAEIERLGGVATRDATIFDVAWPKGVTYRTTCDDRADREVLWAELGGRRDAGQDHTAFGTSNNGKVLICISKTDTSADPMVFLAPEKSAIVPSQPLSIFLGSLEREPTRKRR